MTTTSAPSVARRMLLVHAHPDDEAIGTGATMARYAAEGAHVTLITCTLGEEGEVRVPLYAELAADQANQLGGYRIAELQRACAALGVTDHRFLGAPGRYRDSGMMGLPTNDDPRAFWQADLDQAAGHVADVIREIRPQVVITYDPNGFYGHPDHIQAHRVAMRGVELAADAWQVSKVYWTAVPKSVLAEGIAAFAETADNPFAGITDVEELPIGTPDDQVHAAIDGSPYRAAKLAAMRAHATQIAEDDWLFNLAGVEGGGGFSTEHFTLAIGTPATTDRLEDDLFAGLDLP
jgi:N-acetyl-1-D-myo-inositol-2-amino-2-deoxy-alpha-D-glucopyranoside deacetylase